MTPDERDIFSGDEQDILGEDGAVYVLFGLACILIAIGVFLGWLIFG